MFLRILCLSLLVAELVLAQDEPTVQLHHGGFVRGRRDNRLNIDLSPDPNAFLSAFQGIPYGEAPARFAPPQPHPGWEGIQEYEEYALECIQYNSQGQYVGVEDCLNLNVYSPFVYPTTPFPVMVYIHGGSYERYSSSRTLFGPDYLFQHVETRIVLVAINYRLGVFGFLSLEDEMIPGNNGLRDMIEALRWVQLNIRAFGGDPNRVTVFGQSAGAASVSLLALSPEARGLFHAILTQSGSSLNPWALTAPGKSREAADKLAYSVLGCPDTVSTFDCLSSAPAKALATGIYSQELMPWNTLPFPFTPRIDTESPNPVIPVHPSETLLSGNFDPLPWIMGVTKEEAFAWSPYIKGQDDLDQLNADFFPLACPVGFWLNDDTTTNPEAACRSVYERYLNNEPIVDMGTTARFFTALRDRMFINGVLQQALMASIFTDVWVYSFRFDGKASNIRENIMLQGRDPETDQFYFDVVAHSDDIYYMWSVTTFTQNFTNVSPEADFIKYVTREWTRYGTEHEAVGSEWFKWTPDTWFQATNLTYPVQQDPVVFDQETFRFWNTLLDKDPTSKAMEQLLTRLPKSSTHRKHASKF